MGDLADSLADIEGIEVERDVLLSTLTTWRVGGPAEFLARVSWIPALKKVHEAAVEKGVEILVLGRGSNVLVSDRGFRGLVLLLRGDFEAVEVSGGTVRAGAGAALRTASEAAAGSSLTGLEFAHWIPGTVGGAVMTNAGAHSSSTCSVLSKVKALDRLGEEIEFEVFEDRYRSALVPEDVTVTSAWFDLRQAPVEEIETRIREYGEHRRRSQPRGAATAGSVFRNPEGDSAWRLIEAAGMKGKRVGGAGVSLDHANFIENLGEASAADIRLLMERVADEVKKSFGIELHPEVRLVGFEEE
jgi:UDP-N-acetylmuramate dehydrogenase